MKQHIGYLVLLALFVLLIVRYYSKKETDSENEKINENEIEQPPIVETKAESYLKSIRKNLEIARVQTKTYIPESVIAGHLEEDTIIGKFDGNHVDTLFVETKEKRGKNLEDYKIEYFVVCKSGRFPPVKLYAVDNVPGYQPRIVYEGDLDGNGTDEWGYNNTWDVSQWRTYRIFSWHQKKWTYLIDPSPKNLDEYMENTFAFRLSGLSVAEKSREPGYVLIHTGLQYLDTLVHDTLVKVQFAKITDFPK